MELKLYPPTECAEILSINKATVFRMIHDHTLPAMPLRAGKRENTYRIPAAELERFLDARSTLRAETSTRGSRGRKHA